MTYDPAPTALTLVLWLLWTVACLAGYVVGNVLGRLGDACEAWFATHRRQP